MKDVFKKYPHRRLNSLTGEWILVSPQRWERPWQGKIEPETLRIKTKYDPECYLCPGNLRANGSRNPIYSDTFSFTNDFGALLSGIPKVASAENNLFQAITEKGICRVVCFSPDHSLTLAEMKPLDIEKVVGEWIKEFDELSRNEFINNVLIFENKGELMGNSNPHPHCQIWAQENIPSEILKESVQQKIFFDEKGECLLCSYLSAEEKKDERIIYSNVDFCVLVPFWAVWPYETMIVSRRHFGQINSMTGGEIKNFSLALSNLTALYDRLFDTPFPYSSGIHQPPVDGKKYPGWHFHMHFYPPLLRSASVKKFMVGYELLGNPQRDITPEIAAERLKSV